MEKPEWTADDLMADSEESYQLVRLCEEGKLALQNLRDPNLDPIRISILTNLCWNIYNQQARVMEKNPDILAKLPLDLICEHRKLKRLSEEIDNRCKNEWDALRKKIFDRAC